VVINGKAATKIIASVEILELFLTGKLYISYSMATGKS
jgi:hypothetical protein